MADDRRGRGHQEESQYPPLPGEEDDRRPYPLPPPPMATGVTLPSIQDPYRPGPEGRYPPPIDPRSDPRTDPRSRGNYSTSPQSVNGYAAPPPPANSGNGWNLPPLGPPADQRASYGADRRDYYGQRHQYPPNPYPPNYDYQQQPPNHGYAAYPGDYRAQQQQQQQAAPRQRTSIACRYCRKRKIRCSGYQNTPDGKCTNCKKTGNDCVFQPVSSSTSTAFIPVSAVPGGVPPGTPLYGAFGQPLAPATGGVGGSQGAYPASSDYALPSPTGSSGYYHHPDDRARTGTRRPRAQDDEGMRLPPPSQYPDEDPRDPRRRSPVSMSSNTPPTSYHQYSRADDYDDRTPTPRRNSPGGSTMSGGSNVMALGNLVDAQPPRGSQANNIDQNMLGRLNRRS